MKKEKRKKAGVWGAQPPISKYTTTTRVRPDRAALNHLSELYNALYLPPSSLLPHFLSPRMMLDGSWKKRTGKTRWWFGTGKVCFVPFLFFCKKHFFLLFDTCWFRFQSFLIVAFIEYYRCIYVPSMFLYIEPVF
jgi:hypothetical protein